VSTIPDDDLVARLVFDPWMRSEDKDLIWANVFQFPTEDGKVESVVWRRHAPAISDVHTHGCEKQASDRGKGKSRSTYVGAITGMVEDIKSCKSKSGSCFTVDPDPTQGIHHVHLGFSAGSTKADRSELKVILRSKFGALEPHSCP